MKKYFQKQISKTPKLSPDEYIEYFKKMKIFIKNTFEMLPDSYYDEMTKKFDLDNHPIKEIHLDK